MQPVRFLYSYLIKSFKSFTFFDGILKSFKNLSHINTVWPLFSFSIILLLPSISLSKKYLAVGISLNSITELSIQGETNFHNLPFFHNILLDPLLHVLCIFLGWVGWRKWPNLSSLPSKRYSLFFLLVSLFFAYYDLSWASTVQHIRNDQEIFEFLLSTGIFFHFLQNFNLLKNSKK